MKYIVKSCLLKYMLCPQDSNACRKMVNKGASSTDNEGARPHRSLHDFAESSYLAQLSFVQTGSNTARIDANTN